MKRLQEWVNEVTNGASLRDLGEKLDGNHVTIGRRVANDDPQTAVDIARAYGRNALEPLLVIGFIRKTELSELVRNVALDEASDLELARAIVRKLERSKETARESSVLEKPIELADLAEQRRKKAAPPPAHRSEKWRTLPRPDQQHVADTTPPEPGPGDEGYHDGP